MKTILNSHSDAIVVVADIPELSPKSSTKQVLGEAQSDKTMRFPLCNNQSLNLFGFDLTKQTCLGFSSALDVPCFVVRTVDQYTNGTQNSHLTKSKLIHGLSLQNMQKFVHSSQNVDQRNNEQSMITLSSDSIAMHVLYQFQEICN